MELNQNLGDWLRWLNRVRFLVITLLLGIVIVLVQFTQVVVPLRYFVPLVILWYTLALFYGILCHWVPIAGWHAPLEIVCDSLLVTGLVYVTGGHESYFISLYLLLIIVASILFSRRATFLVAGFSFILLGGMVELVFYDLLPRTAATLPGVKTLQTWILSNLFAFFAVAYLSSLLTASLRRQSAELEMKRGELEDLQAFNEDIIHSMRGGLITTDLEGRLRLLNRTGEEILGFKFDQVRGHKLYEVAPGIWQMTEGCEDGALPQRREVEFRTPAGQQRYLGLSVSVLRTAERLGAGYVINFQDLTDLKRLEQEVVTKERMAALGRLSAAIAHEIRQPLTAMTGALKELARLAPLEDDDKKLVHIVSRESQRLNQIITDFLNYSREKTYSFTDVDVAAVIEETLTLIERDAGARGKVRIERQFAARNIRARADRDALKQVFWNLCNNALRAMPDGGVLTVSLDADTVWTRISIRDTGIGFDSSQATTFFEPFQSGFTGGTGLGLAIVYQILQGHQGRIRVEAEKGSGANFIVELPRAVRPRASTRGERLQPRAELMSPAGKG